MSQNYDDMTPEERRPDILEAVLGHVPFDGWSDRAVSMAARELGLSAAYIKLAFPGGLDEMVDTFLQDADRRMMERLGDLDPQNMRIRDKIATAVETRLAINVPYREAVQKTVTYLAQPHKVALSTKAVWRMADLIWRWAGDVAADYNHYTKRAILSAVYSSTLLIWLGDDSEAYHETSAFLDRRIDNVMQFEKIKAQMTKATSGLPNIASIFGKIRYPERRA